MGHVEVDAVKKVYSGREVLKGISFDLEKGMFFSIIGPSGSGKTTLLKLIDGLEFPDSGSIRICGVPLTDGNARTIRQKIGMVFQNPVLFNASVYENVAYSLRFRGISGSELRERVFGILKMVKLEGLAKRNAISLSGGEAQRVALARALVYDPDLLLLDEPTANLDPTNSLIIEGILKEANSLGKTVILVTHNIFQARRLAKKVAFLLEGEVVELQDTEGLFNNPKDERTRRFISGELYF